MEFTKQDMEVAGCMRRLMKTRFLLRSKNERWFQIVVDLRKEIERVSLSFALALEINEPLGVAFLKPLDSDLEEALAFQVGRKRTLGPLTSALVYKLRHQRLQFYLSPTNESVPLISTEEMREFLQNFTSAKVDTQFERLFRKSLEEMTDLQVLQETKPDSGIHEITPLIEILLPLDKIKDMKVRMDSYFAQTAGAPQGGPDVG